MPKKDAIAVWTPVNPTREYYERLALLHHRNVAQNNPSIYTYTETECVLPTAEQKHGILRGNNVARHHNQFYHSVKNDYEYIGRWDDDMIMPPGILDRCHTLLKHADEIVGVGLFQEQYGPSWILKVGRLAEGWRGAFSRFYIYRMNAWGHQPVDETGIRGDPDYPFQLAIKGRKYVLDVPSIHLDHRCFPDPNAYKVMLDIVSYFLEVNLLNICSE